MMIEISEKRWGNVSRFYESDLALELCGVIEIPKEDCKLQTHIRNLTWELKILPHPYGNILYSSMTQIEDDIRVVVNIDCSLVQRNYACIALTYDEKIVIPETESDLKHCDKLYQIKFENLYVLSQRIIPQMSYRIASFKAGTPLHNNSEGGHYLQHKIITDLTQDEKTDLDSTISRLDKAEKVYEKYCKMGNKTHEAAIDMTKQLLHVI